MKCKKCKSDILAAGASACPSCGTEIKFHPKAQRDAIVGIVEIPQFSIQQNRMEPVDIEELSQRLQSKVESSLNDSGAVIGGIAPSRVLFYFNAHRAYGDEPSRAIGAVESVREGLGEVAKQYQVKFEFKACLSFGQVIVGSSWPDTWLQGDAAEEVNALFDQVPSDSLLVTPAFYSLVSDRFHFDEWVISEAGGQKTAFRYQGKKIVWHSPWKFYGREAEMGRLHDLLSDFLKERNSQVLFVHGEAGIGKTAFIRTGLERFSRREELNVEYMRMEEDFSPLHRPFQKLLTRLFVEVSDPPEKLQILTDIVLGNELAWDQMEYSELKNLLFRALTSISELRPVLIHIDDYQKASSSGKKLISELVAELREQPVFFLIASRILEDFASVSLELSRLDSKNSVQILKNQAKSDQLSDDDVDKILAACNGNPLFISEAGKRIQAGGLADDFLGDRIEFILNSNIDECNKDQVWLIEQAAVLGKSTTLKRLSRFAHISVNDVLIRLGPTGLFEFREDSQSISFRHDLLQKTAYDRINPDRLIKWHERVGDVLVTLDGFPEEIAHHYIVAQAKVKALPHSVAAAKRLSGLPVSGEGLEMAAYAMKLADELGEEKAYWEALDSHLDLKFREFTVDRMKEELAQVLSNLPDKWQAGREPFSHYYLAKGFYQRKEFKLAQEEVQNSSLPFLKFERDVLAARIHAQLRESENAVKTGMRLLRDQSGTLQDVQKSEVWSLLGFIAFRDTQLEQAEEFFKKAFALIPTGETGRLKAKLLTNLGAIAFRRNDFAKARSYVVESVESHMKLGDLANYCSALINLGRIDFHELKFQSALANYDRSGDSLYIENDSPVAITAVIAKAAALRFLGDLGTASQILTEVTPLAKKRSDSLRIGQVTRTQAAIDIDRGNLDQARSRLEQAEKALRKFPDQLQMTAIQRIEWHLANSDEGRARKEISDFKSLFREKERSSSVNINLARLEMATLPGDATSIEEFARSCLQRIDLRSKTDALLFYSEWARKNQDSREAADLLQTTFMEITAAIPQEYQDSFAKRPMISVIKQVLGI